MGWRYFLIAMGGLMFIFWTLRFFVFTLHESPKYLMGKGRNAKAVEVMHKVAAYNGTMTNLSVSDLDAVDARGGYADPDTDGEKGDTQDVGELRRKPTIFNFDHAKSLFASKKLAYSTTLLILLWGMIHACYSAAKYLLTACLLSSPHWLSLSLVILSRSFQV